MSVVSDTFYNFARNKAVANGAVSFYVDRRVIARVSSFYYGADCDVPFEANNVHHAARARPGLPAPEYLSGYFDIILPKVILSSILVMSHSLLDTGYSCRGSSRISS